MRCPLVDVALVTSQPDFRIAAKRGFPLGFFVLLEEAGAGSLVLNLANKARKKEKFSNSAGGSRRQ